MANFPRMGGGCDGRQSAAVPWDTSKDTFSRILTTYLVNYFVKWPCEAQFLRHHCFTSLFAVSQFFHAYVQSLIVWRVGRFLAHIEVSFQEGF